MSLSKNPPLMLSRICPPPPFNLQRPSPLQNSRHKNYATTYLSSEVATIMEHSRTKSTSASPETSISILPRKHSPSRRLMLIPPPCSRYPRATAFPTQKHQFSVTNPVPEAPGTNERSLHNPITTFLRTKEPLSATGGVYISFSPPEPCPAARPWCTSGSRCYRTCP